MMKTIIKYKYILSVVAVAACLFTLVEALGGDRMNVIDPFAITAMLFPILGVVIATNSHKVFYAGFRAVVLSDESISDDMRSQAAALFRLLSKTVMVLGAMCSLSAMIMMMYRLDFNDPEVFNSLGGGIAFILISLLYGLFWAGIVFEPAVHILKRREKRASGKR